MSMLLALVVAILCVRTWFASITMAWIQKLRHGDVRLLDHMTGGIT